MAAKKYQLESEGTKEHETQQFLQVRTGLIIIIITIIIIQMDLHCHSLDNTSWSAQIVYCLQIFDNSDRYPYLLKIRF